MNRLSICYLLVAFGVGCLIRLVPSVISFPYPIGYDAVNYYLPNLYHFESDWVKLITEFPIYIATVYLFSFSFSADIYYSFLASNVVLYGVFSVSIYLLSNKILKQTLNVSLISTIFVIFQLGTLRISWDLFRDLFSLILFNVFLVLVDYLNKKNAWNHFVSVFAVFFVSVFAVFSDRMIGVLLIFVSFIFSFTFRQKYLFMINAFFAFSFLFYFLSFDKITFISNNVDLIETLSSPLYAKNTFSKFDISVLFLSLYVVLIPFFIVGFVNKKPKGTILIIKIPLMVTLFLSFTWIFIPNYSHLAPERWLLIFGIYMSLIAMRGFLLLIDTFLGLRDTFARKGVIFTFLLAFVIYGFLFAVMPYGVTFSIPSVFQENTKFIFPLSMLFNSIDIKDNHEMIEFIEWINSNTLDNSTIIGTKHWRGWFSLFLDPPRKYIFAENFVNYEVISANEKGNLNHSNALEKNLTMYLCNNLDTNTNSNSTLRSANTSLYFVDYGNNNIYRNKNNSLLSVMDYKSKKFVIYSLTNYACNN